MIKIAKIQFPVFNPYIKSTIEIYVSGCNRKCFNCHNSELQNFDYGEELNIKKLIRYLKERETFFDIISIVGGDLLEQNDLEAFLFIEKLQDYFKDKEFWLFTGSNIEQCSLWVLNCFDKIKVGSYKEELKQEGFPASSNQKLLIKGIDYGI